jgi:hypothetical protein
VVSLADAFPVVCKVLIRIERLLRRPEIDRHVFEVETDARPRPETAAHGVD